MTENMHKYRIYIDEVGNHDLKHVDDPNQRYLSLTGVIFELDYVVNKLFPRLEALKKKYFKSHPDNPAILHRKELINKKPPFEALKNPKIVRNFDQELLELLIELDFVVMTVVLDKKLHKDQYFVWLYDPYHYCLKVLIERFVLFMESKSVVGDVMCESRGGKEDMRLKRSFHKIYEEGTEFVHTEKFKAFLTSSQLKVKLKSNNIAGLQIADLIAHPSYKKILLQKGRVSEIGRFAKKITHILERNKYYRGSFNRVWGYGKKWLP
ncbi:MAG: DUF3800 domain-containing protein [Promethearchaeota archaeon]